MAVAVALQRLDRLTAQFERIHLRQLVPQEFHLVGLESLGLAAASKALALRLSSARQARYSSR